jgi:very-short-patch-repair endonuclease
MSTRASLTKFRRATARKLRATPTGAETAMWRELRKLETKGTHFRRQVPIGAYVADFACLASRLIIELDGSHHGEEPTKSYDDARTRWLQSEGYRVLRFWNNDLTSNLQGVMEVIHVALYGSADGAPRPFKHSRRTKFTPPRRAPRADPSPPGEGGDRA